MHLLTLSSCNFQNNESVRTENRWASCSSPAAFPSSSLPGWLLSASPDFAISPCVPPTSTRPTQCLAITIPWNRVACLPWGWSPVTVRDRCASEYGGRADPSSTPVVVSHKWFFWVFPSLSAWPACPRSVFYPPPPFPAEVALEDTGSGLGSAPTLFRPDTRAQTFFTVLVQTVCL